RRGCNLCGRCITGCAHGAKNSLDRNYLYLAERLGVRIIAETRVTHVEPAGEGYRVYRRHPWERTTQAPLTEKRIILSAGVIGTLEILFASRDRYRTLPGISSALGEHVRTNSEAIVGILSRDAALDVSRGTTISTHFHADARTHITQTAFRPATTSCASTWGRWWTANSPCDGPWRCSGGLFASCSVRPRSGGRGTGIAGCPC